jgi:hypothetical protein
MGGVNVCLDLELEEDRDRSDQWSDTESLVELEGEELEVNLQALRLKLSPEKVTTLYDKIRDGKSAKTFTKAERNCGLGYNGLSKCTKQLHDKKA